MNNSTPRTPNQNNAIHLWFKQISDACMDEGITVPMIMSKAHEMQVTPAFVKFMWKANQVPLLGKSSTTELSKIGDIEIMEDHLIKFFGENFELELPPFPHDAEMTRLKTEGNLYNR